MPMANTLSHVEIEAQRPLSAPEAYAHCLRIARKHYENFPVASILLPHNLRKHVAAIYAFARAADDFADEPGMKPEERLVRLNEWESLLHEAYEGNAVHPVFVALRETVREFEIPRELFQNLLTAFRADVTIHRYQSFGDLLGYSRNSANPVGRLVLLLFGYRDDGLMRLSDDICTALQLTNFWQDLRIDLERDRLYIPENDIAIFPGSSDDLRARNPGKAFRSLLEYQVDRTEEMFQAGRPLLTAVGKNLALELRLTWIGGMKILERVRKIDYDVFNHRPALTRIDKLFLLISAGITTRR
ncbi:MAG: squalene synthase HpnC [Ignavibacteria bacterium]|nr:squalene synthase HpnC [Ignavibacteria bacterium]